ncbi:MAG: type VI secretion system baseplate subunit TssG [Treponema sp.]|jgi:type VI secretion system protein ImpH|nr:type VI secretion system baseplate subunit TssG [Treponema sp.]
MEDLRKLIRSWSQTLRQGIAAPDFWGLVRKLERNNPGKPRLGYAKHPSDENIRFGQTPHLYFPSSDIAEIIEGTKVGLEAIVFTYFLGLLGVNGPMPLEFTHYVYQRSRSHYDHTWRRFLDIIHHRMHVFYYRALAQNEQSISFDRPGDDPVRDMIKSLAGLPPEMDFDPVLETIVLSRAENFSFMARNRSGLEDVLRRMLKTAVTVRDFVTTPYDLRAEDHAVLGNPKTAVLGLNLQIGRSCFCVTRRFEIKMGPVDFAVYQDLMSPGGGFELLLKTVNLYLDRPLDYGFVVQLERGTVSSARLGFDWTQANADAAQLGYTCWLGNPDRELELRIDASRFIRLRRGEQNDTEKTA